MRRETQNILLLLLGGALLKIGLDGSYLRYVRSAHQPWLLGAGAVILVLAAVAIGRDIANARAEAAVTHDGHTHGPTRSTWMLVLPVLAIFLIAPPALGSDAVDRSGRTTPARPAPARPRATSLRCRRATCCPCASRTW
ncbi:DUF1980 domain-containing protein [Amycolatopsis sp. NPDC006131]|uniref:DUF1980 domain-containing protein n=1 Tax=Amycolatopsis sp. NPDC006131 TaxID=3156731 RepID=UPI0033A90A30